MMAASLILSLLRYVVTSLLQGGGEGRAEVCRSFDGFDSGGVHGGVLVLGGALAPGDNRAGMAHAAARRSGLSGDEADHRLFHVGLNPGGGGFFSVTANFTDEDDGVSVRIFVEELDGFEK